MIKLKFEYAGPDGNEVIVIDQAEQQFPLPMYLVRKKARDLWVAIYNNDVTINDNEMELIRIYEMDKV